MFNTQYILYMAISAVVTALLLFLAAKWLKTQKQKDDFLKFFAVLTVLLHYSDLWVDYFLTGGNAYITSVHLLPVYPCNVMMWMLLIGALMKDKHSFAFRTISEFCFYVGIVCGVVGIAFNINFDNTPTLADYSVLKGLLSHSTLLVGCIYFKVGNYFTVRPGNALSVTLGTAVFLVCGVGVNRLYDHFGMESPDGMFLRHNPYFSCSPIVPSICVIGVMYMILLLIQQRKRKR